jgi:signal transduction histidine kinase
LDLFEEDDTSFAIALVGIFWILFLSVIVLTVFFYFYNQKRNIESRYNRVLEPNIVMLRSTHAIGLVGFFGFHLLTRVLRGQCEHSDSAFFRSYGCNPLGSVNGLPPDSMFVLMVAQLSLTILHRDVNIKTQLFSWLLSLIVLTISAVITHARSFLTTVVMYGIISIFLLVETTRHHGILFHATQQMRESLKENELMANQVHATEMRHMIANVAHDLKTVSSCLYYLLDMFG